MSAFIDLTDKQKKWLEKLVGPIGILHLIPIEDINDMNKKFGVWSEYENMEECIVFCRAVLYNGEYGAWSDRKKLLAIREVYLIYTE